LTGSLVILQHNVIEQFELAGIKAELTSNSAQL